MAAGGRGQWVFSDGTEGWTGSVAERGEIKAADVAGPRVNPVATICTLPLIAPGDATEIAGLNPAP